MNVCIQVKVPIHGKLRQSAAPWWSKALTWEVKHKHGAFKQYCESLSTEDHKRYTEQRNRTTSLIRKQRQEYEKMLVENIKVTPSRLHKYIQSQQKVKPKINSLRDGNIVTETDEEAAEVLQKYFKSVFVTEGTGPVPQQPCQVDQEDIIEDIDITENMVKKALESLDESKGAGPDGIPSIVLKRCAAELAPPLFILFKRSLAEGQLPVDWKLARVVPIYKGGARSKPENYRPVSMTSQVCKVLERLIKKALIEHLEGSDMISAHQHGFISGKSCQHNLLEAMEDWTRIIDDGKDLDILYLDFQKAFDSVPHRRLKAKLSTVVVFKVVCLTG